MTTKGTSKDDESSRSIFIFGGIVFAAVFLYIVFSVWSEHRNEAQKEHREKLLMTVKSCAYQAAYDKAKADSGRASAAVDYSKSLDRLNESREKAISSGAAPDQVRQYESMGEREGSEFAEKWVK
jgi:hypothetical protein